MIRECVTWGDLPSPLMAIFDGGCSYSAQWLLMVHVLVLGKYFTLTRIEPADYILILIALSSGEGSGESPEYSLIAYSKYGCR